VFFSRSDVGMLTQLEALPMHSWVGRVARPLRRRRKSARLRGKQQASGCARSLQHDASKQWMD
jgi:hypothetical protein